MSAINPAAQARPMRVKPALSILAFVLASLAGGQLAASSPGDPVIASHEVSR